MSIRKPLLWRLITLLISATGIAGVATIWVMLSQPGSGYLALCSVAFVVGAIAALGRMEMQTRVLMLWWTAAMAGMTAALTIMTGAGFMLLAGMAAYLLAGWQLNEAERRSSS